MDVEIEHPHDHHKTGHAWLDKVVPLSALLISIVSIGIAFHHGEVMQALVQQNERLVQANSLPFVELAHSTAADDGKLRPSLLAINSGVGPAHIRSVSVAVDGQPVADLKALLDACCGGTGDVRIASSTLLHRMLQAGETIHYVNFLGETAKTPVANAFIKATNSGRIVTAVCYCSVFEECWVASYSGMTQPKRVKVCPIPKVQYRT